ncbi:MAG: MMPL family transporter, partial [Polyangiaceae bacterium]
MSRIERYVAWVLAHGKIIWTVALVLAIPATWRTAMLYASLKSDVEELLPRDSPSVKAVDEVRARMPGLQFLGVVIDTGNADNVEQADKFLDELAARLKTYPPDLVNSVRLGTEDERKFIEKNAALYIDLPDLKTIRERIEARRDYEAMKATGNLLDEDEQPPPLNFDDIQKKYDARSPKGGNADGARYSSKKLHISLMLIEVGSYATGDSKARELYKRVQADVKQMGGVASYAPGMRLGYSGDVAISTEELAALVTDLSISSVVVFFLVGTVIILYYRWWRSLVILIAPLLLATVYSFALASLPPLSITELNSNTAFLGSIIVGNGINFGIVLLARYVEERRKKRSVQTSIVVGIDGARIGTLSAALAAGASYVSLVITQFRGFRQFGCIGGIGMVLSWCAAFFLMPPLIAWLDTSDKTAPKPLPEGSRIMSFVSRLVVKIPRAIVLLGAALTIGAIFLAHTFDMSHLEYDFSKLRRADTWTNGEGYWGRKMDELLGTYLTPVVLLADNHDEATVIESHVRDAISKPPMNEMVASVRTIDDVLPAQQKEKLEEFDQISEDLTPKIRSLIAEDKRADVERIVDNADDKEITVDDLPRVFLTAMRERDGSVGKTVLVYPRPSKALW